MKSLVYYITESIADIYSADYLDKSPTGKRLKKLSFVHYCGSKSEGLPNIEELKSAISEEDIEFSGDESFCGFDYQRYKKITDDLWEPMNSKRFDNKKINTETLYKWLKGANKWFLLLRKTID